MKYKLKPAPQDHIDVWQAPVGDRGVFDTVPQWLVPYITAAPGGGWHIRTMDGMAPCSPGSVVLRGPNDDRGAPMSVLTAEEFSRLYVPVDMDQEEFAARAYEEYVADIHLDDAGIEAEDIGRKLMRPFLDWMVASSERKVNTKIFVVAFAHFAGWMSYMVNRSTRTDDEFMSGLENLTGLIHNEAVAITSAEERDTNFVIEDLIAEGELKNIDPTAGVPVPPNKGKLN